MPRAPLRDYKRADKLVAHGESKTRGTLWGSMMSLRDDRGGRRRGRGLDRAVGGDERAARRRRRRRSMERDDASRDCSTSKSRPVPASVRVPEHTPVHVPVPEPVPTVTSAPAARYLKTIAPKTSALACWAQHIQPASKTGKRVTSKQQRRTNLDPQPNQGPDTTQTPAWHCPRRRRLGA